jgi:chemotaxis signal transduction protein
VQFFQFRVPGLPDVTLALAMPEVLEVTALPEVVPVPFSPPAVLGLAEWRGEVVTVIDMAVALKDTKADPLSNPSNGSQPHSVIAQVVSRSQRDVIACPVLPGANAVAIPSQAATAGVPADLCPVGMRAAIALAKKTVVLVNLEGLFAFNASNRAGGQ